MAAASAPPVPVPSAGSRRPVRRRLLAALAALTVGVTPALIGAVPALGGVAPLGGIAPAFGGAAPAEAVPPPARVAPAGLREVMFVGNNWDGTADVLRSSGDYARLGRINVIPDKTKRLAEIYLNPIRLAFFLGIRLGPGEGHDQFVDDLYSTPDGSALVASRPSFADVVSIDLATGAVKWRFPVSGFRADHMAVSPDGARVAISASTSNKVHVLDIFTGRELGNFSTGDKPHENIFSADGRYLWNMSIGEVTTDLDDPFWDFTKGDRRITIADTTGIAQASSRPTCTRMRTVVDRRCSSRATTWDRIRITTCFTTTGQNATACW